MGIFFVFGSLTTEPSLTGSSLDPPPAHEEPAHERFSLLQGQKQGSENIRGSGRR
jgi:hypothetical protein